MNFFFTDKSHSETKSLRIHLTWFVLPAVGCSLPDPPAWGRLEQSEVDFNRVTVRCNHSDASWTLICNSSTWVTEGEVTECLKGEMEQIICTATFPLSFNTINSHERRFCNACCALNKSPLNLVDRTLSPFFLATASWYISSSWL